MSKGLVIVESPAKVKSIAKFLGKNYIVKSSVGHIRDLSKKNKPIEQTKRKKTTKSTSISKQDEKYTKLIERMGVDPYNNWKAHYEIIAGKEKILKGLKEAAQKVSTVYLATDLDREGEAIAWHLTEALDNKNLTYKRVIFTEITEKAILKAFEKPSELNLDRVKAQQTRRFLDRVVGYMLSPLLWKKIARGLSAGRVQSVSLRMIAEREKEIHAFKPQEYWDTKATLNTPIEKKQLKAQVTKYNKKAYKPKNKEETSQAEKILKTNTYLVTKVEKKPLTSKPTAPYITSTLQQAASHRLSFSVKKTMTIAQQLYEAGFITYMRTDSTTLSQESVENCHQYIKKTYGERYLPSQQNHYSSKNSAQEAHEAIRPTNILTTTATIDKQLSLTAAKLYELIWKQFVASQMSAAQFNTTTITINCDKFELKTKGKVLLFDGFLRVQSYTSKKTDDVILPPVNEQDTLTLQAIQSTQHFTMPPPRFTEASLVKELEKKSIGRPSTYASIISTIQERGYVKVEQRRFFCLKMGEIVSDRLVENFTNLMDYGFTASMEADLDKIAAGKLKWLTVLDTFYKDFTEKLTLANTSMRHNTPIAIDINCQKCNRQLNLRTAQTGVFLSCSGYNLPIKERCKETINLISGEEVETYSDNDDEGSVAEIQSKNRCQTCDTAMDGYLIDEKRKLHVCGNSPDCNGYTIEQGKFRIRGYEGPTIVCDKCHDQMQLKTGRFGKYFACNSAPDCKNTRKLLKSGEAAPPKADPIHMPELKCEKSDGYFLLRDGASGIFLASNKFPKSRETKKPQVADLIRHKNELDPKFIHLTKAPLKDPDGNPALIRFSRKIKAHYISSEQKGKATRWRLFWQNNQWAAKNKEDE